MKTYKEIGIDFIKPQNREGNDTIKEVLYAVNGIIYKIANRPISPCNCHRYYDQLLEQAHKLAADKPAERAEAKWKEVGQTIKKYLNTLKQYAEYEFAEEDGKDIQRLLNYTLHLYITLKEEGMTPIKALSLLEDWKEIKEDYIDCFPFTLLKTDSFFSMKKELLEWMEKYYS